MAPPARDAARCGRPLRTRDERQPLSRVAGQPGPGTPAIRTHGPRRGQPFALQLHSSPAMPSSPFACAPSKPFSQQQALPARQSSCSDGSPVAFDSPRRRPSLEAVSWAAAFSRLAEEQGCAVSSGDSGSADNTALLPAAHTG